MLNKIKQYNTLTEILQAYENIDNKGITIINSKDETTFISYKSLYRKAKRLLYELQESGIKARDEVILQIERVENFLISFWAGILGGFIVVPLTVRATEENFLNLLETWKKMDNPFLLTDTDILMKIESCAEKNNFKAVLPGMRERLISIKTIKQESKNRKDTNRSRVGFLRGGLRGSPGRIHRSSSQGIAFIQYSSGSTAKPKGIVLTHENILENIRSIVKGIELNSSDSSLSWMPLTHDMGLIGFHLTPLVVCGNHYIMPVSLFVRNPLLWLDKVSEHRISILGSPDFGFRFFLSVFKQEQHYNWDLSAVRLIFNGAEPIDYTICKKFTASLKKYHLEENRIFPVYGLAEATLAVTFPKVGEPLRNVTVNRDKLSIGQRIETCAENKKNSICFVDVGYPVAGCQVKLVDTDGNAVGENTLGRIFIKGKNVTQSFYKGSETPAKHTPTCLQQATPLKRGISAKKTRKEVLRIPLPRRGAPKGRGGLEPKKDYFSNKHFQGINNEESAIPADPGETEKATTRDGWLYTGDLGFWFRGRLVISGREKGVVFVNGRSYNFHDLERRAEEVAGIKARKVAFCGLYNPDTRKEDICAFVVYRRSIEEFIPLCRRLIDHINHKVGIILRYAIPVDKLPLSSSSKLMRHILVQKYQDGEFSRKIAAVEKLLSQYKNKNSPSAFSRDELEKQLLKIACKELDAASIGIHDNLSNHGADSIKLMHMLTEVDKIYPGTLKIIDFFDHQTIAEIAALIVERKTAPGFIPERSKTSIQRRKSLNLNLDKKKLDSLRNIAQSERVSLEVVLVSLYTHLLKQVKNKNIVTVHTIIQGKAAVSLRIDLSGIDHFSELLLKVAQLLHKKKKNRQGKTSQEVDLLFIVKSEKDNYHIIFDFNDREWKREKIASLADLYSDLITMLTDKYILFNQPEPNTPLLQHSDTPESREAKN